MFLSARAIREIESEEIKTWRSTKHFVHKSGYRFYIGQKVYVTSTQRYGKIVGMSKAKGRPSYMVKVNGMTYPKTFASGLLRPVAKDNFKAMKIVDPAVEMLNKLLQGAHSKLPTMLSKGSWRFGTPYSTNVAYALAGILPAARASDHKDHIIQGAGYTLAQLQAFYNEGRALYQSLMQPLLAGERRGETYPTSAFDVPLRVGWIQAVLHQAHELRDDEKLNWSSPVMPNGEIAEQRGQNTL